MENVAWSLVRHQITFHCADNPIIQELLADIKSIALRYTGKPNTEIRTSAVLEQESLDLFKKYGPVVWPSESKERPNWLAEPSTERYGMLPSHQT